MDFILYFKDTKGKFWSNQRIKIQLKKLYFSFFLHALKHLEKGFDFEEIFVSKLNILKTQKGNLIKSKNKNPIDKKYILLLSYMPWATILSAEAFWKRFWFCRYEIFWLFGDTKKNDFEDQYGMVGAFNLQTAYIQYMPYNYINKPDLFNSGFKNYLKDNF